MRRILPFIALLSLWFGLSASAAATDTLRVGNRVLVKGDSAATVIALLGKPTHKSHRRASRNSGRRGKHARLVEATTTGGEQWQYRHNGRVIVVTLIDGRVGDIEERGR